MTLSVDPRVEFERRYAYQALETCIARGDPEMIVRGPRGTGKTMMICDLLFRLCWRYPGIRQTWLRKHRARMDDTVLAVFEDELLGLGHPLRSGASRENRKGYDIGNGSRIMLTGMDDADRSKSLSTDVIWVNECNELTEREWEEIGAANRERVGIASFPLQVKLGDCNPMPPAHWTNARCADLPRDLYPRVLDDGRRMGEWLNERMYAQIAEWNLAPQDRSKHKTKMIVSCHADNVGYWTITPTTWGWAPPGLKYATDKLGMLSGNLRQRYLEGRPVAHEGSVFPEFDYDRNTCEPFPAGWPKDYPVFVGFDSGYDHPCAVIFYGIGPNGQAFVFDEIYGSGMTLDDIGPKILERLRGRRIVAMLADPRACFSRTAQGNGVTIAEYMRKTFDLSFSPWPAAEGRTLTNQVEAVRSLIRDPEHPLQVWQTCQGTITEFLTWSFKRKTDGSIPEGDDAYEDRSNDAMDAIRGIVAARPTFGGPQFSVSGGRR